MGQDSQVCAKCGVKCGYDDDKALFDPGYLCGRCKRNLVSRFAAFFGLNGAGYDQWGVTVPWRDMDGILSKVKRDEAMRVSYVVADRELYERTVTIQSPVESNPSLKEGE